ncbi:MAG: S41 family peptidase [Lachnospiraceae bacterium]|nr:S41 family peptidase [Lachnospiraceae bacterium]
MNNKNHDFFKGLLSGLLIAVFMLGVILFGSHAYSLITGNETAANVNIINKKVTDKVKLIEQTMSTYYLNDIDQTAMQEGIYKGIVDSLEDPYSVYYTQEELDSLLEMSSGVYYGIGLYLSQDPKTGLITVVRPIEDSPSAEVGIIAGDILYAVDDQLVDGQELSTVVTKVKGLEGTKVKMTFYREGEKIDFEVERREIKSETVFSEMKDKDIGYISIAEFDDVTFEQFKNELDALEAEQMKGLIIDLRGNPGGNLDTVVKIADLLLPKGMIVYTEDKDGNREEYKSDDEQQFTKPLVVMIDGNSASASEILSGAIKDYKLGTLVGTTSFGKGIVQRVIPLGDGTAIKLTISKYYTPNGKNIHGIGIEPDITVDFDSEAYETKKTDNQLDKAMEVLTEQMFAK